MKTFLLGTSALCAVALAGPAFAQTANEPVKLGIGGYFNSAYGYIVSQSGKRDSLRADDINTDAILNFKGSTKLDNGFVVGASMQIRATNQNLAQSSSPTLSTTGSPDTVKRSYGYIRSDFGEVRIGDDDDARRQKAMTAPIAGPLFGANTPDMIFSNGPGITNTTMRKLEGEKRVSRLAYFTPTIAGFSFAFSYAPGGEKGGTGSGNAPNTTPTNGVAVVNNAISGAGSYSGKFGDFGLDAYVGVSNGHRSYQAPFVNTNITGRDNPFAASGGGVVTFGPFAFGGAYEHLYDRDTPVTTATTSGGHQKRDTWDVGGRYTIGPFAVSLDWTRAILQNRNGNSSAQNDIWGLSTDYVLGPGIDVGIGVDYTHYKSSTAADPNYSGLAIMAGTGIAF
jgi:outer membrane protein OmpU